MTVIMAAMLPDEVSAGNDSLVELTSLAESGEAIAQLRLGMRYRDGDGVAQNYREALRWYRRCADQGDPEGMDNVGYMYLKGWGVPVNFEIATGYFKASAAQNHPQGLFNLGNSYFSGQGVEQDYVLAIAAWREAAVRGHQHAKWRLATLYAAGEGLPLDRVKAEKLCERLAREGHVNGMLLLGELLALRGDIPAANRWWTKAAEQGSAGAEALLRLQAWRDQEPLAGTRAYVEVNHLYQGWNNCGATSIAMFARQRGAKLTPYDVKRLCPQSPIGTGTDWEDLVSVSKKAKQSWKLITFPHDEAGFEEGAQVIREHLDADRPVVIDFTVIRQRGDKEERFGHTLLVVGYNRRRDEYVLKNPNQPPPGIELMSAEELEANWYSVGYSRLSKGRVARPLIVFDGP